MTTFRSLRTIAPVATALAALFSLFSTLAAGPLAAEEAPELIQPGNDPFRQLEEILPTPNVYRTASGAPGHRYWQQRADYDIAVEIDEEKRWLHGEQTITYHNQSPDTLRYLWLQIDQNLLRPDSLGRRATPAPAFEHKKNGDDDEPVERLPFKDLRTLLYLDRFEGGATIHAVKDADGEALEHAIVETMLRVDLPAPLPPGESFAFEVAWSYPINDAVAVRTRSGYECFDDGHCIFEIAQWFPRLAAYSDDRGWHHKQFLGRGEFTLEFGDYRVAITVPEDHVVAATGELQNPDEVLSEEERQRLARAMDAEAPVFVVTPEEAKEREEDASAKSESEPGKKTWVFEAENVRDFAFATSRTFIWDAWHHQTASGRKVLAMSFYPEEAEPLWSRYSTHAVVHTMELYSHFTFEYPYPVAISVNGPVGGMEYPMISFNAPRPEDDRTYWGPSRKEFRRNKYGLISVIIHEVGHNYFPMIVNSDERQWTWMDEGLNTFVQSLAEQYWEEDYPAFRGEPEEIVEYMLSENQVPIMSNSESLLQFGNNAYAKPAAALNILRDTVLGQELFDFALREYARRWQFKRPQPADFFRTMEDASGVDLDWFWRGWFYSTEHVDIAITGVRLYEIDTRDPEKESAKRKVERDEETPSAREAWGAEVAKRVEKYPDLKDFYNAYDPLDPSPEGREDFAEYIESLEPWEKELLGETVRFYVVDFDNVGGLVMPILLEITYADGSTESLTLPAEIWRKNPRSVKKMLVREKEITAIQVDPRRETADADVTNNRWPPEPAKSRFQLFKEKKKKNPMQQLHDAESGTR